MTKKQTFLKEMLQITAKEVYRLMISDLITLQFDYATKNFEENFETLSSLISKTPKNSLILAPELCLSGYKYDMLKESSDFSQIALPEIKELSQERIVSLTLTQKIDNLYFNNAKIFYGGKEVYSRAKTKLFSLGEEEKYFAQGDESSIKIVEIKGIKIALLVCFELRFLELWEKTRGADVILIPSYWGKSRKSHLESLSKALAIINQCFVIVANSSDEDMASSSCIISPFGDVVLDDNASVISTKFDKNTIRKMRRYINVNNSKL
jgi:predicted amidohydrolase